MYMWYPKVSFSLEVLAHIVVKHVMRRVGGSIFFQHFNPESPIYRLATFSHFKFARNCPGVVPGKCCLLLPSAQLSHFLVCI